ncbi:unnamed protein product [Paramecium pentaurelia]|uniref:Uncharacterized protein n=1 Tax=Paramecium pentaurelia TaxID=43138 RepID=A0A8S1YBA7_9CILI|nr:unnamed protein product [Paramecium pentaurelia]
MSKAKYKKDQRCKGCVLQRQMNGSRLILFKPNFSHLR